MLSKRKEEHGGGGGGSEDAASYPSVEGAGLPDTSGIKSNPTLTSNGPLDDSGVKVTRRHVHWKSDSDGAEGRKDSTITDPDQHSLGIEPDNLEGKTDGGSGEEGGKGEKEGEGVRPLSGHRLISVKPFAASSGDEERDADDDGEDVKKPTDSGSAITPSLKFASGVPSKSTVELSEVGTPQPDIHSDLPVIDLESDACSESGDVEERRCVNELHVEDVRAAAAGVRSDTVKPKSFLADINGTIDIMRPVTAFDSPNNSVEEVENNSIPIVTVSYLRHDPLAAAGDAARGAMIPEIISDAPSHSNENQVDIVLEGADGGATAKHGMAPDAPDAASASTAATAADLTVPAAPPLHPSASSSSSQSMDRSSSMLHDFSSDLSLLRDPVVDPVDSTSFARVEPDEAFLEERGECDGAETPAPVYILPGSNLRYTDDMILTTRPPRAKLLYSPAPPRTRILFQIIREKLGFYRKYYAHLELNGEKIFYLGGRKRVKSRSSSYVISIDQERMLRSCDAYIGKLKSNYMGTKFTLYDTAEDPPSSSSPPEAVARTGARSKTRRKKEELASIIYAPNPLGFYGPRRMTVILPAITENDERISMTSQNTHVQTQDETLLGRYKARQYKDLIILHNKPPVWERAKNSYVLNFHGRVTQPSVKNFQLVPPDDHNDIVMQFGRTGANTFTMDYRRPLSGVQAFGIVLSCFDCKLACE